MRGSAVSKHSFDFRRGKNRRKVIHGDPLYARVGRSRDLAFTADIPERDA